MNAGVVSAAPLYALTQMKEAVWRAQLLTPTATSLVRSRIASSVSLEAPLLLHGVAQLCEAAADVGDRVQTQ